MQRSFAMIAPADVANVEIVPMGQLDALEVAAWTYPDSYAFYDFVADPEDLSGLLDASHRSDRYFSVTLESCGLLGFVEVKPPRLDGSIEIGFGLRPDCTGRGLGLSFVEHVCEWVVTQRGPVGIVLEVAAFNARAIAVYERAGFCQVAPHSVTVYGQSVEFITMEKSGTE